MAKFSLFGRRTTSSNPHRSIESDLGPDDPSGHIWTLVRNGRWIDRRVTTARVVALRRRTLEAEFRSSISINLAQLHDLVPEVSSLPETLVPLGLCRKDLLLDFDLRNAKGDALQSVSRWEEARIAAEHVISTVDDEPPTSRLTDAIRSTVSSLTGARRSSPIGYYAFVQRKDLLDTEREWIARAKSTPAFDEALTLLGKYHVLVVRIDPRRDRIVKLKRVENLARRRSDRFGAVALRFRIPDFGWPMSDHVRIEAPPEVALSDAYILTDAPREQRYTFAGGPSKVAFYHFRRNPTDHSYSNEIADQVEFRANLWPGDGGYLTPVATIAVAVSAVLLGGSLWEFLTQRRACGAHLVPPAQAVSWPNPTCHDFGALSNLSAIGGLDAAVGLGFLALTLMLVYVLRADEPPVRFEMLRGWRNLAALTIALPWLAAILLLTPRPLMLDYLLWASWLAIGLGSLLPTSVLVARYIAYRRGARSVKTQQPVPVTATWELPLS